jgi:hypothetical protein
LVTDYWQNFIAVPPGLQLGGTTWLIAIAPPDVPEPGSLTLASLGIACVAGVAWARRRRGAAGAAGGLIPGAGSRR